MCVFKYQLSRKVLKVMQTVQGVTDTTEPEITDIDYVIFIPTVEYLVT